MLITLLHCIESELSVNGLHAAGGPGVKKAATKRGAISQLAYGEDDIAKARPTSSVLQPPAVKKLAYPATTEQQDKHVTEFHHLYFASRAATSTR